MKEAGALGVPMVHVLNHAITVTNQGQGNVTIRHPTEELVKALQWNSRDATSTCHVQACKPNKQNSILCTNSVIC